ncbi:Hypothetical_protein [Hexamita inflata]|uniref:Hypothetical_protein n=1 Tax=Hexamita inflata TaxID=28002 RepID=A0AA86QI78_9EUKA|nr:Hypothetical protein HINF_LOCUS47436 [Hexamita inflata]
MNNLYTLKLNFTYLFIVSEFSLNSYQNNQFLISSICALVVTIFYEHVQIVSQCVNRIFSHLTNFLKIIFKSLCLKFIRFIINNIHITQIQVKLGQPKILPFSFTNLPTSFWNCEMSLGAYCSELFLAPKEGNEPQSSTWKFKKNTKLDYLYCHHSQSLVICNILSVSYNK